MISDVLWEGAHEIRQCLAKASKDTKHYLREPAFADVYTGKLRQEIEAVVAEMDRIRAILDTPPK